MRIFLLVSMTLLVVTIASGQFTQESKASGQASFDRPTTYIEYVCKEGGRQRLRLVNNSVWAISFSTDEYYRSGNLVKLQDGTQVYSPPEGKNVTVYYRVDRFAAPWATVDVPKFAPPDSGVRTWIAPAHAITFSVPSEYLRDDLQIYVVINYEWELRKNGTIVGGTEHRVAFRGIDRPQEQPPCAK